MILETVWSEVWHRFSESKLDSAVRPISILEIVAFEECVIGVVNCPKTGRQKLEKSKKKEENSFKSASHVRLVEPPMLCEVGRKAGRAKHRSRGCLASRRARQPPWPNPPFPFFFYLESTVKTPSATALERRDHCHWIGKIVENQWKFKEGEHGFSWVLEEEKKKRREEGKGKEKKKKSLAP